MATLKELAAALDRLNTDFPRPGLQLAFSNPYVFEHSWPHAEWPNSKRYGVYAFLDGRHNVLYLGKASCQHTLGQRLGAYFQGTSVGRPDIVSDRAEDCVAVATLGLDKLRAFEAPAIEEYLISRVPDLRNVCGARESGEA